MSAAYTGIVAMMRRMIRLRRAMSAGIGPMGRSVPALSVLSGRLFRGAPLAVWLAVWALKDLRRPDSRIREFARLLTGRAVAKQAPVISVEPPAALNGPGKRD